MQIYRFYLNYLFWILTVVFFIQSPEFLYANIHQAPILLKGSQIREASRYPIAMYRLYRSNGNGKAISIPFQIDEINEYGDYVLDQGPNQSAKSGNGVFDLRDEISFMGNDVGPVDTPKDWQGPSPTVVYEVKFQFQDSATKIGAVYIALFFDSQPKLSSQAPYVIYDVANGSVITSRYRYEFDKKNHLVLKTVDRVPTPDEKKQNQADLSNKGKRLIDGSFFYMKADLKYFLTFEVNHRSIDSKIEAFKTGPIRTIARISFFYSMLRLKFELGMYTEVSFFSNSVMLPAMMYNPIDGSKSINQGSGFYYGFNVHDDLSKYQTSTNMPVYQASTGILDYFKSGAKTEDLYWFSGVGKDHMLYAEIRPSKEMQKKSNIPRLFLDKDTSKDQINARDNTLALPLGKSPVNLALYFDLSKFDVGEHLISFQLFFENTVDPQRIESFKTLKQWQTEIRQL